MRVGWRIPGVAVCGSLIVDDVWAGGCIDIGAWPVRRYTSADLGGCSVCDALLLGREPCGEDARGLHLAGVGSGAWVPAVWVAFGGGGCIVCIVWVGQCGVIGGVGLACGVMSLCGSVWVMVFGGGPPVMVAKNVAMMRR